MKKILDMVAAFCLAFDIDWDTEYEDDAYVVRLREQAGSDFVVNAASLPGVA